MGQATPAALAQNTYALDKLLADIKARVGAFLGNEKVIFDGKTRLDSLLAARGVTAQLKANAQALKAKADALLTIQKDAENAAQALIGRAGDLRTRMETDPKYSFLKDQSSTFWGIRQLELIGDLIMQTAALLPEGASLTARLLKQNNDVKTFANEVGSTENAAAGTGALPMISGIINSTVGATASSLSGALWPIALGLGAVVLLYGIGSGGFLKGRR